jgi:hypothetical protein
VRNQARKSPSDDGKWRPTIGVPTARTYDTIGPLKWIPRTHILPDTSLVNEASAPVDSARDRTIRPTVEAPIGITPPTRAGA